MLKKVDFLKTIINFPNDYVKNQSYIQIYTIKYLIRPIQIGINTFRHL